MTLKERLLGKKIEGASSMVTTNINTGEEYVGPIRQLQEGETIKICILQAPYRQNSLLMRILTGKATKQLAN